MVLQALVAMIAGWINRRQQQAIAAEMHLLKGNWAASASASLTLHVVTSQPWPFRLIANSSNPIQPLSGVKASCDGHSFITERRRKISLGHKMDEIRRQIDDESS